jgi:hypothetical protein
MPELQEIPPFNQVLVEQLQSVVEQTEKAAYDVTARLQTIDEVVTELKQFVGDAARPNPMPWPATPRPTIGGNRQLIGKLEAFIAQRVEETATGTGAQRTRPYSETKLAADPGRPDPAYCRPDQPARAQRGHRGRARRRGRTRFCSRRRRGAEALTRNRNRSQEDQRRHHRRRRSHRARSSRTNSRTRISTKNATALNASRSSSRRSAASYESLSANASGRFSRPSPQAAASSARCSWKLWPACSSRT